MTSCARRDRSACIAQSSVYAEALDAFPKRTKALPDLNLGRKRYGKARETRRRRRRDGWSSRVGLPEDASRGEFRPLLDAKDRKRTR